MRKNVLSVAAMAVALVVVSATESQAAFRRGCSSCGTACSTCTVAPATAAVPAADPAAPVAAVESKPAVTNTAPAAAPVRYGRPMGRRAFSRR